MPDPSTASWLLLGSFAVFLVLKVPITFSLAVSSIITAVYLKIPLMAIMQQMVQGVNSFSLLAIPFFIIAGEMMGEGGISRRLIAFSNLLVGRVRGGLAQVNVLASMFFGGISGSAVANVYGTGSFTIPLMKRIGYKPFFAGAVEAVASTGGQIMPPVMGAGAFVMAALLGVPFNTIMIAAMLPALLYYGTVLLMVHLTALRDGLKGLPADELPTVRSVMKKLYMMSPIVLLVYMLLAGYTPMYGAIAGISLAWAVSLFNPGKRMGPKEILQAIHDGSENIPLICTACASAGLVIGSVALSGIGFKFVGAVLALSGGIPFLALVLIAVVSLVLGMGLPTTSAYILGAALGVPALAKIGIMPLAAHLFVFYYAIISNITPPVALAAYAAASIAGSPPNRTGFAACRLGILAFIVPFAFCYDPGLLLKSTIAGNLISIVSGVAAMAGLGFAITGFTKRKLSLPERLAFAAFGLLALHGNLTISLGSTAAVIGLFLLLRPKPEGAGTI
jgi:TRAP transporter 4TM/12TM fusion protein